jgi:hypothetical protein
MERFLSDMIDEINAIPDKETYLHLLLEDLGMTLSDYRNRHDETGASTTEMTGGWTLIQALKYIRDLQPKVMEAGWCLLLGGSILNKGLGADLDLICYPRTDEARREDVLALLPIGGTWEHCDVGDIYCFGDPHQVEVIFQTHFPR